MPQSQFVALFVSDLGSIIAFMGTLNSTLLLFLLPGLTYMHLDHAQNTRHNSKPVGSRWRVLAQAYVAIGLALIPIIGWLTVSE